MHMAIQKLFVCSKMLDGDDRRQERCLGRGAPRMYLTLSACISYLSVVLQDVAHHHLLLSITILPTLTAYNTTDHLPIITFDFRLPKLDTTPPLAAVSDTGSIAGQRIPAGQHPPAHLLRP